MSKVKRRINVKIRFIMLCFVCFFLVLAGRVYYFKTVKGAEYEQEAISKQITRISDSTIPPNRGAIVDRNKQPLAVSTTVYNVAVDPVAMKELDDAYKDKVNKGISDAKNTKEDVISALNEIIGVEKETLYDIFSVDESGKLKYDGVRFKYIKKGISREEKEKLEEMGIGLRTAVVYEKDTKRNYVLKTIASNVVGFIRGDTKWGLESEYDIELSGVAGRSFISYDSDVSAVRNDILPEDGSTIVTTIDYTIQQYAEEIARKAMQDHNPENVSVMAMNPNTGEIYAMAQGLTFDGNNPSEPLELSFDTSFISKWENMTDEEKYEYLNSSWNNFNVSSGFEPGSIFKPMVVAACLEEGVVTPDTTFNCTGSRSVGGWDIPCNGRNGHGIIDIEGALAQSCNVAMMDMVSALGAEKFYKYQKDFGIGELTHIDLPGEVSLSNMMYDVDKIGPTELATMSFGQSFTTTPIQVLNAFSAVINGGKVMRPYVVSQIIDNDGNIIEEIQPEIVRRVISKETSDIVRKDMESTLTVGTGKKARIEGYAIGGKTGTAQQGKRSDYIHTVSFISYYPVDNPEIISMVVIHKPEQYIDGVTSPAPYMKEFMEDIIKYKAYEPDYPVDESASSTQNDTNATVTVEDYTGKSAYETVNILDSLGLTYEIVGSGDTIVNQAPHSGATVNKGSKILLYVTKGEGDEDTIQVPDVLGKTYSEASEIIKQSGFTVTYEGKTENMIVSDQEPKSGVFAVKGSNISLTLEEKKDEEKQEKQDNTEDKKEENKENSE